VLSLAALAAVGGACHRPHDPNDAYRDPNVSAAAWNQLFESSDRQIFAERAQIMRLVPVQPGARVADVGAGTGLFSMLLADAVGADGVVYAEEIAPKFAEFLAARAARERRANVVSTLGTDVGVGLPPGSIDLAFLCDVYHHFDHPREMLASIHLALRPGGQVFLVDYRREPGRSPAWLLEHVRAGELDVVGEIEASGFTLVSRDESLRDSYALRFRRDPTP
jgi:predicted methyltransferase